MEVTRKTGPRGDARGAGGERIREERQTDARGESEGRQRKWKASRRRRGGGKRKRKNRRSAREAAGAVGYLLAIQPLTMPL